jgi:hypothetical protein
MLWVGASDEAHQWRCAICHDEIETLTIRLDPLVIAARHAAHRWGDALAVRVAALHPAVRDARAALRHVNWWAHRETITPAAGRRAAGDRLVDARRQLVRAAGRLPA